jgi:hypothetical protein
METDLSDGLSDEELSEHLSFILILWQTGVQALNGGWPTSYIAPGFDDLISVLDPVLDDIVAHRNTFNISIRSFDSNTLVNYFAWHLRDRFESAPLFYGHFHFLDWAVPGNSLRGIPHLPLICENLQRYHRNGEIRAPYCFIKGVDLTISHCRAVPSHTWTEVPDAPRQSHVPPPPASRPKPAVPVATGS